MTYLNTINSRRNPINWPASFGTLEKQLDSLFAGFPSFFDVEAVSSDFAADSGVKLRWYQKDDGYLARLDLPGVSKKDIGLEIEEGYLKVNARRDAEEGEASFEYRKSFKVPDEVDVEKIAASYENGVLSLSLPKGERAKPRKIKIK